jgi:hypothetical protein
MSRKTIPVREILDAVNGALSTPDSSLYLKAPGKDRELTTAEALRMGHITFLEMVLLATGNYHGFGYQEGVVHDAEEGEPREFGDETRRIYYS